MYILLFSLNIILLAAKRPKARAGGGGDEHAPTGRLIGVFFLLFSFCLNTNALANEQNCISYNYVFDIGSGTSKSAKYEIDRCEVGKLEISFMDNKSKQVPYQHCIEKSGNKTLTKDCIEEAKQSIKEFKEHYGTDCQKEKCYGIATAWARNAKNTKEVLKEFQKEGIDIRVVSQQDEGRLAYEAVVANLKQTNSSLLQNLIVLDVGGGSHQLTYSQNGQIKVYNGAYGSANLRSLLIKNFGPKYGITEGDEKYFPKAAIEDILLNMTRELKVLMQDLPQVKYRNMVGIGGVIKELMMDALNLGSEIKKTEIKEQIFKFSEISFDEAKAKFEEDEHPYIPFMQSALILVYSIMDVLGVDTLHVSDVKSIEAIVQKYYANDAAA